MLWNSVVYRSLPPRAMLGPGFIPAILSAFVAFSRETRKHDNVLLDLWKPLMAASAD